MQLKPDCCYSYIINLNRVLLIMNIENDWNWKLIWNKSIYLYINWL